MTVQEIQSLLEGLGKKITTQGIHYHLRVLGIRRKGVARPADYPQAAEIGVLKRLGFVEKTPAEFLKTIRSRSIRPIVVNMKRTHAKGPR